MSPRRSGSAVQAPGRALEARSVREQKNEKDYEPGNHSSSCVISGSCDRKQKVFTGDLSQRLIATGNANANISCRA